MRYKCVFLVTALLLCILALSACSQKEPPQIPESVSADFAAPVLCELPIFLTKEKSGIIRLHGRQTTDYFYGVSDVEILWADGSAESFSTKDAMREYWAEVPEFDTGLTQAPLSADVQDGGIQLFDFNFDGYTDIGLQAQVTAYNQPYVYWFYAPEAGGYRYHGSYPSSLEPFAEFETCTVVYNAGQDYYADYYKIDEAHNLVLYIRQTTQFINGEQIAHTEYFS